MKKVGSRGFTIVELMIATVVLSVLLIMVTVVMIGIGNLYYKGITQSRVQDAVRTTSDDIDQHLQLSSKLAAFTAAPAVSGHAELHAYCIGSIRYTYAITTKIGDSPSGAAYKHVLWRDNLLASGCAAADLMASNPSAADSINTIAGEKGTELIPDNSYLTVFQIVPGSGNTFTVNFGIAFGDVSGQTTGSGQNTACNLKEDRFCATSYLSTTAVKRLD